MTGSLVSKNFSHPATRASFLRLLGSITKFPINMTNLPKFKAGIAVAVWSFYLLLQAHRQKSRRRRQ
jgi:hypothetical protein